MIQSFLLAFLTYHWVKHPEQKWLNWVFGVAFVVVLFLATMGVLAGLGIVPTPAQ